MIRHNTMDTSLIDALLTCSVPPTVKGSPFPRLREGTFPTDLEVDSSGYPSDARVEEISLVAAIRCREWLHDVLPEVWKTLGCYGTVRVADTEDDRHIYLATGGWSGCEVVINEVLGHFFMRTYLAVRTSGGGYTFVVPHT